MNITEEMIEKLTPFFQEYNEINKTKEERLKAIRKTYDDEMRSLHSRAVEAGLVGPNDLFPWETKIDELQSWRLADIADLSTYKINAWTGEVVLVHT